MSFIDPAIGAPKIDRDVEGLARRLRLAREHAGLTQQQFAARIGYSRRQVLSWENGTNLPPIWALAEVRRAFDIDPEWVLSGPGWIPLRKVPVDAPDRRLRLNREVKTLAKRAGLTLPEATLQNFADLIAREPEEVEAAAKLRVRDAFQALSQGGCFEPR
ncbi:helix-turn-helix transcriptional regulator [Sphingomonas sp. ZB1N12]|uniref:helix-turn-helix transcriptional regulator n=1 Tax=Sphingomonas arabinosi TaxID=3096160 RepID=UPI003FA7EE9E